LRLDRVLGKLGQNVGHRLVEINPDHVFGELFLVDLRQVLRRIGLKLLEEDAVPGDLALGLAVGRTGDAEANRQRGAVAGQADNADIMTEILAAELRADAHLLGQLVDFGFHFEVAESVARIRAAGGQFVEIAGRGELDRLEVHLGRVPPMTIAR
jgi:hypothetical protein